MFTQVNFHYLFDKRNKVKIFFCKISTTVKPLNLNVKPLKELSIYI